MMVIKESLVASIMVLVAASALLTSCAFFRDESKVEYPRANLEPTKRTSASSNRWQRKPVPLNKYADMIVYGNAGSAAIVGSGTILISRDNGLTWESLDAGKGNWRVTTDGGATYKELRHSAVISAKEICNVESAVVTPSGRLYLKSVCEHTAQLWSVPITDTNQFWQVVSFTYDTDPSNGVFGPASELVLAGDRVVVEGITPTGPAILTSDDDGSSWRAFWRDSLFGKGLAAFDFLGEQTGWMLLGDGELRKTTDAGESWETVSRLSGGLAEQAYSLKFITMRKAYIVGAEGLILTSEDAGITWKRRQSSVSHNLFKVLAVDTEHAWAVGNSKTILETFDGGNTWKQVQLEIADNIYYRLSTNNGRALVCSGKSIYSSF